MCGNECTLATRENSRKFDDKCNKDDFIIFFTYSFFLILTYLRKIIQRFYKKFKEIKQRKFIHNKLSIKLCERSVNCKSVSDTFSKKMFKLIKRYSAWLFLLSESNVAQIFAFENRTMHFAA